VKTVSAIAAVASLAFSFLSAHAQRPTDIVKWNATVKTQSATAATVELSAEIQNGWHVYALSQSSGGPTPLKVTLPEGDSFALNGPVHESTPTHHFDPNFKMDTAYYLSHAQLQASLKKVKPGTAESIPINVRFQTCNDTLCLPPYTAHLTATGKK
jgi:hypothetical protein